MSKYDLLIIGGGINGAGIARDAAGRGLKVLLCEKDDLAAHTSSSSTKLIHGGLRYLEHFAFRLVRESLIEREVLLRMAPHIIWPLRFVLPYDKGMRPAWLLRLGLMIYDHIGGRKELPPTTRVNLQSGKFRNTLKHRMEFGFEYSDCWVDDARLVVLNAIDAAEHGAEILTRTCCTQIERKENEWKATLQERDGKAFAVNAKAIINAAGPWVEEVQEHAEQTPEKTAIRLIKGSHIVVPRKFPGDECFIFQNKDDRIIFAIPYEHDYTLIGTTDVAYQGDLDKPEIAQEEITYLCDAASEYFEDTVKEEDVVWTYAGVRPLFDDNASAASSVTRDYVLKVDAPKGAPPLLSIYGGKITTFRKLAEAALDRLAPHIEIPRKAWTRSAPLPGGDLPNGDFGAFLVECQARYPWMPSQLLKRLARSYGTRIKLIIGAAGSLSDLGDNFGAGLTSAEINYLRRSEFAQSADDILWRRTKLGLHMSAREIQNVHDWLADRKSKSPVMADCTP